MHEKIVVLDLGSRLTQLIARAVRAAGVYAEIIPIQQAPALVDSAAQQPGLRGIILSGNDAFQDAADTDLPTVPGHLYNLQVPVLGIAAGMHAMARHFGAEVDRKSVGEG